MNNNIHASYSRRTWWRKQAISRRQRFQLSRAAGSLATVPLIAVFSWQEYKVIIFDGGRIQNEPVSVEPGLRRHI